MRIIVLVVCLAFSSVFVFAGPIEPLLYTVSIENRTDAANGGLWAYEPIVSAPVSKGPITDGVIHSFIDFSVGGTWVSGTSGITIEVQPNEVTMSYDVDWNLRGGSGWALQSLRAFARVDVWAPNGDTVRIARIPELENNGFSVANDWYREEVATAGGFPFGGHITVDGVTYGQISAFGLPPFPVMGDIEATTGVTSGPRVSGTSRSLDGTVTFIAENLSRCSCEDELRGSLQVVEAGSYEGIPGEYRTLENGIMDVIFVPKNGIEAAKEACGVDRFNFRNWITSDPENFTPYIVQIPKGSEVPPLLVVNGVPRYAGDGATPTGFSVEEASYPIVDPIIQPEGDFEKRLIYLVEGTKDTELEEDLVKFWSTKKGLYSDSETPYYLYDADLDEFLDTPSNPSAYVRPGIDYTGFASSLIGITEDGEEVSWTGLGTNWLWKSYSTEEGGRVEIEGFRQSFEPRLLDFGIRDVTFDLVPEPSTYVPGAMLYLLLWGRGIRSHHHASRISAARL